MMIRSLCLRLSSGSDVVGSLLGRSPKRLAAMALAVLLLLLSLALVLGARPAAAASNAILAGFNTNTLAANDDGSTGLVDLPFPIDFFNSTYNSLYVNNNGNVTFNNPLGTYTPSALTSFGSPIIAPFWADVDTAVAGSGLVTYGNGTVDGHTAFGVNWPGVDCFVTAGGGLNYFQLLIIDRSDIAPGDFDIEFNYNSISWDSGQASGGNASCLGGTSAAVGYTNGSTNALELNGSFQNGAFLDNGPDALAGGSQNSTVAGRYIFPIRAGGGGPGISVRRGHQRHDLLPRQHRDRRHLRCPRRAHRELCGHGVPAVGQRAGPGHVAHLHRDRPGDDHGELHSHRADAPAERYNGHVRSRVDGDRRQPGPGHQLGRDQPHHHARLPGRDGDRHHHRRGQQHGRDADDRPRDLDGGPV
jgi:hypothetical protein